MSSRFRWGRRLGFGFAIYPHYLLARGVRHARENARLGDRGVGLVLQHSGESNVFVPERLDQQASGLVFPHHPDR